MLHFLDIDDCISNPCHTNAVCKDAITSYTCECKKGFTGDGATCRGNLIIIFNKEKLNCSSGFTGIQYEIVNNVLIL